MVTPLPDGPEVPVVDWKEEHAKLLVKFQELHRWLTKCGVPVDVIIPIE